MKIANWIFVCVLFLAGANPMMGQTAFTHRSSTSNTKGHVTTINNPNTNGQPNKLLFITKQFNGKYQGNQAGVWYSNGKWTIYNENRQTLTPTTFNVLAVNPSATAFQHKSTEGKYITTLNHPRLNGYPNAVLLVTQNWKGQYNPKAIGVWYNSSSNKWTIYNQDKKALPKGTTFNVLILQKGSNASVANGTASIFTADAGTKQNSYGKHLSRTPFTGPNTILFITQNYSANGPYNTHVPAVWRDGNRWTIYNDNKAALPEDAHFNVLRIGGSTSNVPVVLKPEGGFRVMINGLHCLQTGDAGNGTDEPYVEVYVDGSKTPIKWGSRRMNEADRSWWEKFTDKVEQVFERAQQEFWLMPGSVYAKEKVRIVLWEEDDGRGDSPFINNDDKIGEFTIYKSTPDNNFIEKTFNGEDGHYKMVATKFTRKGLDLSVEGKSRQIPVRVPILDQGSEGACVAFSTVGALTSTYLNKTKPGSSRESLFDPIALYNRRNQSVYPWGWQISSCLDEILKDGIPFKNSSKRLILKDYYVYHKDGRVIKRSLGPNNTFIERRIESSGNGHNKMRAVLKSGEPLIVDYSVYPDFMAYAHVQAVYGGNIARERKSRHAVFVVGYNNPAVNSNTFPTWTLQNSWGPAFGNNGLCTFAEGACEFDDVMYRIGDFEVR
ncbi:MAG: C1 family peptidase [Bacteroidota bacterium]